MSTQDCTVETEGQALKQQVIMKAVKRSIIGTGKQQALMEFIRIN